MKIILALLLPLILLLVSCGKLEEKKEYILISPGTHIDVRDGTFRVTYITPPYEITMGPPADYFSKKVKHVTLLIKSIYKEMDNDSHRFEHFEVYPSAAGIRVEEGSILLIEGNRLKQKLEEK